MVNIDKALEAARRVEAARAALRLAEEEFAALAGAKPANPATRKPIRGRTSGGPSVSQRVLGLITQAGPAGIPRKDIVAVVGKDNETAVHSALKVHQGKGLVKNESGLWVATKKLVQQMQAPRTVEAALMGPGQ
jgi:hypothetical protein